MEKKYNGWANYATWRVQLEIFDGMNPADFFPMDDANIKDTLPEMLEDHAKNALDGHGLATDYAFCFLSDVDWHQIANRLVDDYVSQNLMEGS